MDHTCGRSRQLSTRCCCEVRPDGAHVTVALAGEVDMSNADEVTDVVVEALRRHRPRHLHVDLREVTFLGAAGARALAQGRAEAGRTGCDLDIEHPNELVSRVLALCGSIHPTGPVVQAERR